MPIMQVKKATVENLTIKDNFIRWPKK